MTHPNVFFSPVFVTDIVKLCNLFQKVISLDSTVTGLSVIQLTYLKSYFVVAICFIRNTDLYVIDN